MACKCARLLCVWRLRRVVHTGSWGLLALVNGACECRSRSIPRHWAHPDAFQPPGTSLRRRVGMTPDSSLGAERLFRGSLWLHATATSIRASKMAATPGSGAAPMESLRWARRLDLTRCSHGCILCCTCKLRCCQEHSLQSASCFPQTLPVSSQYVVPHSEAGPHLSTHGTWRGVRMSFSLDGLPMREPAYADGKHWQRPPRGWDS